MSFKFERQLIKDIILITPEIHKDNRGIFIETYKKSIFEKNGILGEYNQENYSKSKKGVLRGLHFQKYPFEQAKIIRCISGKILDVAVDIRKNSKTFGKYIKVELSAKNKKMLYIPKGFAHGFVVLSKTAEVVYKTQGEYNPNSESGIIWNDNDIGINWGINFEPILSEKDKQHLKLKDIKELR